MESASFTNTKSTNKAIVFWSDEDQCYIAQSIEHQRVSASASSSVSPNAELDIALASVAEVLAVFTDTRTG